MWLSLGLMSPSAWWCQRWTQSYSTGEIWPLVKALVMSWKQVAPRAKRSLAGVTLP